MADSGLTISKGSMWDFGWAFYFLEFWIGQGWVCNGITDKCAPSLALGLGTMISFDFGTISYMAWHGWLLLIWWNRAKKGCVT